MPRRKTIDRDAGLTRERIGVTERRRGAVLPPSLAPRGLSRFEASAYIGVSPSLFDEMVKDGRMPAPKRINARTVWDRKKLDESFEALPDDGDRVVNPWDDDRADKRQGAQQW